MALRRMFAKSITDSDDFLDLPLDAQLLYFHLGMQADDDGLLNSTRKIMRLLGMEQDVLRILSDMGFVLRFPSGVVAIRHWRVNNKLRRDRHTATQFQEEWTGLTVSNDVYEYRRGDDNQVTTQSREGEEREGEASAWEESLAPWSAEEWTEESVEEERIDEARTEEANEVERSAGGNREEKNRFFQPKADQETRVVAPPVEFSTNPQPTEASSAGVEKEKNSLDLELELEFQRKKEKAKEMVQNYQFPPLPPKQKPKNNRPEWSRNYD